MGSETEKRLEIFMAVKMILLVNRINCFSWPHNMGMVFVDHFILS